MKSYAYLLYLFLALTSGAQQKTDKANQEVEELTKSIHKLRSRE